MPATHLRVGVPFDQKELREMRQYLHSCTNKCVSICTFVLVKAGLEYLWALFDPKVVDGDPVDGVGMSAAVSS
jgi:hypothetical protein